MLEIIFGIMCSRKAFIRRELSAAGWYFNIFETLRWTQRWEFEAWHCCCQVLNKMLNSWTGLPEALAGSIHRLPGGRMSSGVTLMRVWFLRCRSEREHRMDFHVGNIERLRTAAQQQQTRQILLNAWEDTCRDQIISSRCKVWSLHLKFWPVGGNQSRRPTQAGRGSKVHIKSLWLRQMC